MNRLGYFERLSSGCRALLIACITWLVVGSLLGAGVVGSLPIGKWPPIAVLLFLAINAYAGAIVVSDFLVSMRPNWKTHWSVIMLLAAGSFFVVSVAGYYISLGARGGIAF